MLPSQREQKRALLLICACLCLTLLIIWTVSVKQSFVDLMSGRSRDRTLICGVCVFERIRETRFSLIVGDIHSTSSEWRIYSETGMLYRISPHFIHHSTPALLEEAVLVGEMVNASWQERCSISIQLLELLRRDDFAGARELMDAWRLGKDAVQ